MPTKKVTCPKRNPVLLTVYVERPKRRPSSSTQPYVHHTVRREVIHYSRGADGQGYVSRRAGLLQYSQRLRLSARSAPPASSSKPYYQKQSHINGSQPAKQRRLKDSKAPSRLDNWKMPSVFGLCTSPQAKNDKKTRSKRSGSTSSKIKAVFESLKVCQQGQKKQSFFSKLFLTSSKSKRLVH